MQGTPEVQTPLESDLDPILFKDELESLEDNPEAQEADLCACCGSPWYWLVNHVFTLDEHDATGHPFKRFPPRPYLQVLADQWFTSNRLALPKSRQIMVTWLISLLFLGEAQFRAGRRNVVQSTGQAEADAVIARARVAWERQPPWIQQRAEWSASRVRFPETGSEFIALPGGAKQVQGYTMSGYFMDEVADHLEARETYEAVLACVRDGARMVMVGRCPFSWWQAEFLANK